MVQVMDMRLEELIRKRDSLFVRLKELDDDAEWIAQDAIRTRHELDAVLTELDKLMGTE